MLRLSDQVIELAEQFGDLCVGRKRIAYVFASLDQPQEVSSTTTLHASWSVLPRR